jgi:hypothetical protein
MNQGGVNGCRCGEFDPLHNAPMLPQELAFGEIAMLKRSLTALLVLAFGCAILSAQELSPVHAGTLDPLAK